MKKAEQLYDALTGVDEDLVEEAAAYQPEPVRKPRRWRWAAAIAALLAVAILVGTLLRPDRGAMLPVAYALETPVYPEMAPIITDYSDEAAYHAWYASVLRQQNYRHAYSKEDLRDFLAAVTPAVFAEGEGQNRVCSPLSLYIALGMLAETTDGESRAQILSLLGAEDTETLRTRVNALWNANYSDNGSRTCLLASSLWLNDSTEYRSEVLKTLAENYYTASYKGKMGSADYDALLRSWLDEQTGNLLQEYTEDISLDPETVLALATTVQFQAKWVGKFPADLVWPETFHGTAGDRSLDFLHRKGPGNYYWSERFGAVNLGFDSGGCMWFLLPDEGVTPEDLLADPAVWDFLLAGTEWPDQQFLTVDFAVPKFDVSSRMELSGTLQTLGVVDVFDQEVADFSPLCEDSGEIYVSRVEHDARLTIDEEGCSAAALTMIQLVGAAPAPDDTVEFVLDRPFVFVVTGIDGLPLFIGTVNNP